jgi:hypothetical protein
MLFGILGDILYLNQLVYLVLAFITFKTIIGISWQLSSNGLTEAKIQEVRIK